MEADRIGPFIESCLRRSCLGGKEPYRGGGWRDLATQVWSYSQKVGEALSDLLNIKKLVLEGALETTFNLPSIYFDSRS